MTVVVGRVRIRLFGHMHVLRGGSDYCCRVRGDEGQQFLW